jgi:hypothetical protein
MKSTIFRDTTPCSPLKVNGRFGGTYRLHLQGRLSRATYQLATWFRAGWLSPDYTALYPWRQHSSWPPLWSFHIRSLDCNKMLLCSRRDSSGGVWAGAAADFGLSTTPRWRWDSASLLSHRYPRLFLWVNWPGFEADRSPHPVQGVVTTIASDLGGPESKSRPRDQLSWGSSWFLQYP